MYSANKFGVSIRLGSEGRFHQEKKSEKAKKEQEEKKDNLYLIFRQLFSFLSWQRRQQERRQERHFAVVVLVPLGERGTHSL